MPIQQPNRFAHGAGQMCNRGVDGNDQVEIGKQCGGIGEIVQVAGEVDHFRPAPPGHLQLRQLLDRRLAFLQAVEADARHIQLRQVLGVEGAKTNPFLHLSMHLSISEQCSIDQPRGIRQAVELLAARRNSLHDAHHEVMECLGQMIWESQRAARPPDGQTYIDCVQRRATGN